MDKSRDNSLFQETSYFECCSESKTFVIFLEKVYTFKSSRFCGIDFQRSIALNEIICLLVFVLTCGLYKFFGVAYLVFSIFNQTLFPKRRKMASAFICSLIKRAKMNQSG